MSELFDFLVVNVAQDPVVQLGLNRISDDGIEKARIEPLDPLQTHVFAGEKRQSSRQFQR